MPAQRRLAACLAVSLLAHGALGLALPTAVSVVGGQTQPQQVQTLRVLLRQAASPGLGAPPASEGGVAQVRAQRVRSVDGGAAVPAAKKPLTAVVTPKTPPEPMAEVPMALPAEPLAEPPLASPAAPSTAQALSTAADDAPAQALSPWRLPQGGAQAAWQAQQAPPQPSWPQQAPQWSQQAARWSDEAQWRDMQAGSLWMDMGQRLSGLRARHEGFCQLQRRTGFLPNCQGVSMEEWSAHLGLQAWATKLAELDPSLQELRLSASQGRWQLQAVTPGEALAVDAAAGLPLRSSVQP